VNGMGWKEARPALTTTSLRNISKKSVERLVGKRSTVHMPVFVFTHHPRKPVEMQGGTTFHFITDGIHAALEHVKAAARGKDLTLGGGASVAQQYLKAGLIDEMESHVVPILLGDGARSFR